MPERVFKRIEDEDNEIFVSVASIWEMVIKSMLGRLDISFSLDAHFKEALIGQGMQVVDISYESTIEIAKLPMIHADPFDRLLIAQARVNNWTAITHDEHWKSSRYGIEVSW